VIQVIGLGLLFANRGTQLIGRHTLRLAGHPSKINMQAQTGVMDRLCSGGKTMTISSAWEILTAGWSRGSRFAAVAIVVVLACGAPASAQGYAAVAIDGHGGWGASLGQPTPSSAGIDALSRCPGRCRVVMTGPGRCVAFADSSSGGYWYGNAYGPTAGYVRRVAFNGCASGAPPGTCRMRHVNCG
jgi:hypothetical protein